MNLTILVAEIIGTALLVLLGNGVVAGAVLNKSKSENSGWISITAGWGFAVMVGAYAVGRYSGAHLNPAVTLGLFAAGSLSASLVPVYLIGEFVGAFLGQILVVLTFKGHYDVTTDKGAILATFSTGPAIRNDVDNLITEIIGTFVLVFGILMLGGAFVEGAFFNIFMVGILVWGIGLSLGGPTGYAINPARDLAPRILHSILPLKNKGDSDWSYAYIPVVGPIIGGVLAGLIFKVVSTILV